LQLPPYIGLNVFHPRTEHVDGGAKHGLGATEFPRPISDVAPAIDVDERIVGNRRRATDTTRDHIRLIIEAQSVLAQMSPHVLNVLRKSTRITQ